MKIQGICCVPYALVSFVILFSLVSISFSNSMFVYTDNQDIDSDLNLKLLDYFNPSTMMKIKYPSFWQKFEFVDNNMVSFVSPIGSVGVIIQNKPTPNLSINEITMNTISYVKKNFSNVNILNTTISKSEDDSFIQTLEFVYSSDLNKHKVLLSSRTFEDRTYLFSYYADEALFDQYFSISAYMKNSFQIPSFVKAFPSENLLGKGSNTNLPDVTNSTKAKNSDIFESVMDINKETDQRKQIENYSTFYNKSLGIEIEYPVSFVKTENDRGVLLSSNKSVGIMIVNLPINNPDLDDFSETQISSLNRTLANFNILNYSTSDLLGDPTQMLLFNYYNSTELYKGMQFWKLTEDDAFIFTYFAPSLRIFDEYLSEVIRIIDKAVLT